MAKLELKHNSELTKDKMIEVLRRNLKGKYEVYRTSIIGADFIVKKSAISGLFVRMKQNDGRTEVVLTRGAPSGLLRVLLGILPTLFAGKAVLQDVSTLLETSPDFK